MLRSESKSNQNESRKKIINIKMIGKSYFDSPNESKFFLEFLIKMRKAKFANHNQSIRLEPGPDHCFEHSICAESKSRPLFFDPSSYFDPKILKQLFANFFHPFLQPPSVGQSLSISIFGCCRSAER